jgi:hypothetical protein
MNSTFVMARLFQLNRRVLKAYLLKESRERLWGYHYKDPVPLPTEIDGST